MTVMEEIRQIEETEGFEGPKISGEIKRLVEWKEEWIEDIVVGEIGRACDARGWDFCPEIRHCDDIGSFYLAIISQALWENEIFVIHERGNSLAHAAAEAYLAALKAGP